MTGTQVAAAVQTARSSRIVLLDLVTHAVVRTLATLPAATQADGVFDGRHAIWKESADGQVDPFVVKLWTAATGKVEVVGHSRRMADGNPAPSPWQDPVIAGGRAAWVEGTDAKGAGEIVVLDMASRQRAIAHRGHPGWLALTPSALIWAESSGPGAETTIQAQNPLTGAAIPPPEPLGHAIGAWGFVTDGTSWAWVAPEPSSSSAAPSTGSTGEPPTETPALFGGPVGGTAREIAPIPLGGAGPPLAISHGVVTVPVSAGGLVVADLATGGWALAKQASWATPLADGLLVGKMRRKGGPEVSPLAVVGADSVASLHC